MSIALHYAPATGQYGSAEMLMSTIQSMSALSNSSSRYDHPPTTVALLSAQLNAVPTLPALN